MEDKEKEETEVNFEKSEGKPENDRKGKFFWPFLFGILIVLMVACILVIKLIPRG